MMKVYDTEHQFLSYLTDHVREIYTTATLEAGTKSLCFQIPCDEEYLSLVREEYYIETEDYEYIVKELVLEDNNFFTVFCGPNIEELKGSTFRIFDCFEKNPQQAYTYCITPVPSWSIEYNSETATIMTLQTSQVSVFEMLKAVANWNGQELWFDTKNKIVKVYDRIGRAHSNVYYSNELKLRRLSKQSSTYDYATVLYPIGKNGLTIAEINNGRDYLENFTYSNKRIEKYWFNDDIDVAERLMGAGEDYLESIAQPNCAYKIDLCELGDAQLGDTITIVDDLKRVRQNKRIIKIVDYPLEPERSQVEVANRQSNFARTFIDQQKVLEKELRYIHSIIDNFE